MAYDDKIKQYAKTLYLTLDNEGQSTETMRSIAQKCTMKSTSKNKKVPKPIAHKTIIKWCQEGNWELELKEIQRLAKAKIEQAEKELKEKADTELKELMGKGATNISLGKMKNHEIYKELSEIVKAKAQFTKMFISRKKPDDLTWEQVTERMLTETQLSTIFNKVADREQSYDEMIADASLNDSAVEVSITIVDPKTGEGRKLDI